MQGIIDEIRDAVIAAGVSAASFIHGRSFDSALETITSDTTTAYAYLDPIVKTGLISTRQETYSISIGFIKQDAPDSSPAEREVIVDQMDDLCLAFLQILFDLNVLEDGTIVMFDTYTISPIYRIKNVCSGVLCTFSVVGSRPC